MVYQQDQVYHNLYPPGKSDSQTPLTRNRAELLWQVTARKCSCKSSWCPICWGRYGKVELTERLNTLDWEFVRHVELTVSRDRFKDGEGAFEEITHKRGLGSLLKELERADGVPIVDWVGVVEWHVDGFPHWHLFIEVESKGKEGMIGHGVILRRWPFGVVVWESPILSEDHWKHIKGYFDRNGYFGEGKGHQGKLPEWGRQSKKRIKRWQSMRSEKRITRMSCDESLGEGKGLSMGDKEERLGHRESYESILSSCGARTFIEVKTNSSTDSFTVDVDYGKVKCRWGWEYVEGKGLMMNLFGNDAWIGFLDELREMESVKGGVKRGADRAGEEKRMRIETREGSSLTSKLTDCVHVPEHDR